MIGLLEMFYLALNCLDKLLLFENGIDLNASELKKYAFCCSHKPEIGHINSGKILPKFHRYWPNRVASRVFQRWHKRLSQLCLERLLEQCVHSLKEDKKRLRKDQIVCLLCMMSLHAQDDH